MNRAEKRKMLAKAKKKAEFAKQLTPIQKEYIDEIVELTKQNTMLLMADVLDVAMTGALVEDTDLTMEEIFKINMKTGLFIGEIQRENIEIGVEERKMNLKRIEKEGIKLELTTGFGADKTATAVISGDADIAFMGPEATIYQFNQGNADYLINFAQLTQRAGNFVVSREKEDSFKWEDLKGKKVIGGRPGGMPEMVFEYVLKKHGMNPQKDINLVQNIDFANTSGAFVSGEADYTVEFEPAATLIEEQGAGYVVASVGKESG